MDLQKVRIYGACNVLISYELVEYTYQEKLNGEEDYAVLHRVQLEPTCDSTLLIDCPLTDSDALTYFENMLSKELGHITIHLKEVSAL